MRNTSQDNFFQPVISTLGLFVSLVSAVSPIFSSGPITSFFLTKALAPLSGFIAFVFGLISIWMIFEHYRFVNINIGEIKDRGRGFPEPRVRIDKSRLLLILYSLGILSAFGFLFIGIVIHANEDLVMWGFIQAIAYVTFFVILMSIFAFLVTSTIDRLRYAQQRDDFPWTVFSTLEKNKLVSTGIEFYENNVIYGQELSEYSIQNQGNARIIKVRTIPQEREIIEVITSYDGKELIKILKKQEG